MGERSENASGSRMKPSGATDAPSARTVDFMRVCGRFAVKPTFLPTGVTTIDRPFFCPRCNAQTRALFEAADGGTRGSFKCASSLPRLRGLVVNVHLQLAS